MTLKKSGSYRFRISTVFMLFGIISCFLQYPVRSKLPTFITDNLQEVFKIPLLAVIFIEGGPEYCLLGFIFALAAAIANFKNIRTITQSTIEMMVCFCTLILFPLY